MTDPQPSPAPLPMSLRIVAYVTIILGVSCALDIVIAAWFDEGHPNFGVLQIPAGLGLLRRSRGWRTFLLICIWLGYAGFVVGLIALAMRGEVLSDFPDPLEEYGKAGLFAILGATLAYMIWEHHVLTRPKVKRFFGLTT